jgi:hypothetical protein
MLVQFFGSLKLSKSLVIQKVIHRGNLGIFFSKLIFVLKEYKKEVLKEFEEQTKASPHAANLKVKEASHGNS